MEEKQTFKPIGEEMMQIARKKRIGARRFRFPITSDQAYQVIGAFYNAEVERRGKQCQFSDFTLDKILQLANIITSDSPKFGILLCGSVGNGKTTLMQAVNGAARYLQERGIIKAEDYGYQYSSDFGMTAYNAKQLTQIAKSDWKRFEGIMATPMLALDELGEEPKEVLDHGNVINPIIDLIEHRYNLQRFTMITTNLDPDEISIKYGSRIADRFREMLSIITFGNQESFRR